MNHQASFIAPFATFIVFCAIGHEVRARPRYQKVFVTTYEQEYAGTQVNTQMCTVCHDRTKNARFTSNNYGEAIAEISKNLDANGSDEVIRKILKDVEDKSSAIEGITFGDLIKGGRLPASK